jgi:hypothetical protein
LKSLVVERSGFPIGLGVLSGILAIRIYSTISSENSQT